MAAEKFSKGSGGVLSCGRAATIESLRHGTPFIEKHDYDQTLMAWWENFDRTYSEIAVGYDRKFYQMWKFYLLAAAGASRSRDGQLYQMVLTKTGRKQPDCRAS